MNKIQHNYFTMVKAVLDLFDQFKEIWKNDTLIADCLQKLYNLCASINEESIEQRQNSTKGYTNLTDRQKTELKDLLYRIASRMKAYACKTGDEVIAAEVSFSRSSLENTPLQTVLTIGRSVAKIATQNLSKLAVYKITEEDVTKLADIVDTTEKSSAHRDAVKGNRIENTSQLVTLFTELRKEIKFLDTLTDAYIDDEKFLGIYYSTRRIHDARGRSTKSGNNDNNDA